MAQNHSKSARKKNDISPCGYLIEPIWTMDVINVWINGNSYKIKITPRENKGTN